MVTSLASQHSRLTSQVQISSLLSPQGTQSEADKYQCCCKESSGNNTVKIKDHFIMVNATQKTFNNDDEDDNDDNG